MIKHKLKFQWKYMFNLKYLFKLLLFRRDFYVYKEDGYYEYHRDFRLLFKVFSFPMFLIIGIIYGLSEFVSILKYSRDKTYSGKFNPKNYKKLFKEKVKK